MIAVLASLLLANALVLAPAPLEVRLAGCLLLFVALPGWMLSALIVGGSAPLEHHSPTRPPSGGLLLAIALGLCSMLPLGLTLTLMAAVGILRPLQSWHIAMAANALVLALLAPARWRRTDLRLRWPRPDWALIAVTLVAGVLRLWDLGWSEFQGDEARILLRAMAAIQGVPDALLAHRKVPGEILVTLMFYGQLGETTELAGRLPFALAGVAGAAAFTLLARELFDARVALLAGLLLAVNGYFVGFGRILQYESPAFLLGTLGLLCAARFGRGAEPRWGLALAGSALLCAAGLIALGAMFLVAPAAVLAAPRIVADGRDRWRFLALWLWPAALAAITVAAVLAYELLGQRTGGVLSYLGPRLGGERPYWNWVGFFTSANHYLSTPYVALVLGGGVMAMGTVLASRLSDGRGRLVLLAAGIGLAASLGSWARLESAALVAAIATLAMLLAARSAPPGTRAAVAWAAGPLIVHGFLIRFPGTHWREAFPGLILLSAALLVSMLPSRTPRWLSLGGLGLVTLAMAHFCWVTLVQRWPEYQMTYPDQRHWLDWSAGPGRGIGGVFGASHRHGWKALALLQEQGAIPASYATNESPAIAAWYLRRPQGCPPPPALIVRVPRAPQDRNLAGPVPLPAGYVTIGTLQVEGRPTINLEAAASAELRHGLIDAATTGPAFDREMTSPWRPVGPFYQPDMGAAALRRECAPAR